MEILWTMPFFSEIYSISTDPKPKIYFHNTLIRSYMLILFQNYLLKKLKGIFSGKNIVKNATNALEIFLNRK